MFKPEDFLNELQIQGLRDFAGSRNYESFERFFAEAKTEQEAFDVTFEHMDYYCCTFLLDQEAQDFPVWKGNLKFRLV